MVKQFAKLIEFVLIFDERKMENPALQNDFSYFRRTLQRTKHSRVSVNPSDFSNNDKVPFKNYTGTLVLKTHGNKIFKQDFGKRFYPYVCLTYT